MAAHTVVELLDDLDGTEADETVSFAVDGTSYEIDLNGQNAERLREALGEYIPHARKAGNRSSAPRRTSRSSGSDSTSIRTWAQDNGYEVSARGRISKALKDAYHAAVG